MQAISRVRHPDKYQCVLQCIEKEDEGFECIVPIRRVTRYHKHFKRDGKFVEFIGDSGDSYWEAVYRKKLS